MRKNSTFYAFVYALTLCSIASAQVNTYMELLPENGFPTTINCIYVEDGGFAWLGSNDGIYSMLAPNYFTVHTASDSDLPGNNVRKVISDTHGYVWVLTDRGFVGYKSTDSGDEPAVIKGPEGPTVAYSASAKLDVVYFGGKNCIWAYNHRTGEFSTEVSFKSNTDFPITDMISASGNSWNDLVLLSKGSTTYYIYNVATQELREKKSELDDMIMTGFADSVGDLWLSLFKSGVVRVNNSGEVIARYNTSNSRLSSDVVLCFEERDGKIWMGTEGGGINVLNPVTGEITSADYNGGDALTIPTSTVTTMFCDHNGHMWCGRKNGGAFVIIHPQIKSILTGEIVPAISPDGLTCFYQDETDKLIWMGTQGSGLLSYDPEAQTFTRYPETSGLNVFSIASLGRDQLFLSCPNQGGYVFDKAGRSISEASVMSSIYSSNISNDEPYIINDSQGRLLIFGDAVRRWDRRTNVFESIDIPAASLSGNIHPVFGTRGEYIFDRNHLYKSDNNDSYSFNMVCELEDVSDLSCATVDAGGIIWMAEGGNIHRYNPADGSTSLEYSFDGSIMTITSGLQERLWIGMRDKLLAINTQTHDVITLTAVDGVRIHDFKPGAMLNAGNGDLLLGGQSGLLFIGPSYRFDSSQGLDVKLTSIAVDGITILNPEGHSIPTIHNGIDVNFFSHSSDILKSAMYHVVLTGPQGKEFDETTDIPHVHLTRLEPGSHTLSVSATDFDGSWTESKDIYTFHIGKPWYRSWWFSFILFLLVAGTAGAFILRRLKRKNAEKERQINDERYNFLINVSHELRTPLTLISGPLRRYLKTHPTLDESSKATISKVCLQADRMTNLLNTVLTTSKIQEGADKITPVPTPFNDWLFRCVDQFYDEANGLKMDILLFPDASINEVRMDEHMCSIVLSNIISNALKHNEQGTPLTIWSELNEVNGTVRVNVKDHGSGIGDVDVSKLFERYYQATEEHTGFGIGLSYSKTIIDAHHGDIGAYNNLNDKGATFWFELPADVESISTGAAASKGEGYTDLVSEVRMFEEKAVAATAAKPGAPKQKKAKPLSLKTVLFVDDDKDLRDYVADEIAPYCGRVLLAVNGKDALEVLGINEVDIIISDIMMPEIDGLELCTRIKSSERYSHIPVILLTARADDKTREDGRKAKADYYMPKPFDIDNLVDVMKSR